MQTDHNTENNSGYQNVELADYILNSIPLACCKLNKEYRFTYLNYNAERLFQINRDNAMGANFWEIFPELKNSPVYGGINEALYNHEVFEYEYLALRSSCWIKLTAIPGDHGVVITFRDIQELKEVQLQLLQEKRQHEEAQRRAHIGHFEHDIKRGEFYWSDELYRIHGLEPQSETITLDRLVSFIHPQEQEAYRKMLEMGFADNQTFQITHRIINVNGDIRVVNRTGEFIRNEDGELERIQGTVQDITESHKAHRDKQRAYEILETIEEAVFELDEQGHFCYVNRRVADFWNKEKVDFIDRHIWEVIPHMSDYVSYSIINDAIVNRHESSIEFFSKVSNHWTQLRTKLSDNGTIVTVINIDDRKKAEIELQQSRDLLQSIFDTSLVGMAIHEAVRNEQGEIVDFRIRLVNKELERLTGRTDLLGKLYGQEFPGIKVMGLFDSMLEVVQTGKHIKLEYNYTQDGFQKWFSSMFVKMDDGLIATNLDITERKQAENQVKEDAALIKGIADAAPSMLYVMDIQNTEMVYANNKVQELFDGESATVRDLSMSLLHTFVHPEDMPKVNQNIEDLRSAADGEIKELLYRLYDKNGKMHWIKTRRTVFKRDDCGKTTHIIGLSEDFTEQIELRQKNLQLQQERKEMEERQQQEIFEATLTTQEEERRRIAESLHNGLGQVLYAIKLSLDHVNISNNDEKQTENLRSLQQTSRLLADAIKESRRISHELMPTIIDDFGLRAAIEDIQQHFDDSINIKSEFVGFPVKLDKHIEIAIYRIVQELIVNVVKHAQATEAVVRVEADKKNVGIEVRDNGKGFTIPTGESGIGLKTIQSKVKLLNGTLIVASDPDEGVLIQIRIPLKNNN